MKWNLSTLERFKQARDEAVKADKTVFTFEGQEVFVPYAKYLIQFLENRFGTSQSQIPYKEEEQ